MSQDEDQADRVRTIALEENDALDRRNRIELAYLKLKNILQFPDLTIHETRVYFKSSTCNSNMSVISHKHSFECKSFFAKPDILLYFID